MLVLNPSFLVVGLPHGCSGVWGIYESHDHSGKAPELVALPWIKMYTDNILYPTADTSIWGVKNMTAF